MKDNRSIAAASGRRTNNQENKGLLGRSPRHVRSWLLGILLSLWIARLWYDLEEARGTEGG